MKRTSVIAFLTAGAAVAVLLLMLQPASGGVLTRPVPAPEFTHRTAADWINSPPLMLSDLRGKVVLVDFWAFECWNCYRSFPWLNSLEARLAPHGLEVIGVHAPEFDRERVLSNVKAKVQEFGLHNPIMIDNDFSYWHALDNRYWPAFYVIDKSGRLRAEFIGETHEGDRQAQAIEAVISELLKEQT